MSDNNNDTSAIDSKKKEASSSKSINIASKIYSFIISLIIIIFIVMGYFSLSGLILFICKLAQSSILPTEGNCFPYTNNEIKITPIQTNIFTTNIGGEDLSMKLEVPYNDYNASNKIIDMFREYKNNPNSHFLGNYFIAILEELIRYGYSSINLFGNLINELPESVIVGFGPIIFGILYGIALAISPFYGMILWFSNMGWFFKTNSNKSGEGLPKWDDVTLSTPLNYAFGIGLIILFAILFFPAMGVIMAVPFILLLYCGLSSILYNSAMNGKKTNSFTVIKDVLKYYKLAVVSIISIATVILAFSRLGTLPGIFSILTVALIYWGIISIDVFRPISETNLTPVVSNRQALKKCVAKIPKLEKHGFLYNFLFGQKGGDITRQLQKAGRYL